MCFHYSSVYMIYRLFTTYNIYLIYNNNIFDCLKANQAGDGSVIDGSVNRVTAPPPALIDPCLIL